MSILLIWILICVAAYLAGSIPFGLIMGKLLHRKDIRSGGSGNIGATNALRQYGAKTGVLVLLLDLLKGFAVSWLALNTLPGRLIGMIGSGSLSGIIVTLPLLAVILGHMFPIWLGGKGGKGVATAAGVFLAYAPLPVLIAVLVFIILTAATKYVSVGSLAGALVLFFAHLLLSLLGPDKGEFPWFTLIVSALIISRHQGNILRLLEGNENKLSLKRKGGA